MYIYIYKQNDDLFCMQVIVEGNPIRRGTVMYNGPLEGKSGIFIGVQYDEPLGKNNGR